MIPVSEYGAGPGWGGGGREAGVSMDDLPRPGDDNEMDEN